MTSGSAATSSMRYPAGSMKPFASSSGVRAVIGGFGEKSVDSFVCARPPPNPPARPGGAPCAGVTDAPARGAGAGSCPPLPTASVINDADAITTAAARTERRTRDMQPLLYIRTSVPRVAGHPRQTEIMQRLREEGGFGGITLQVA